MNPDDASPWFGDLMSVATMWPAYLQGAWVTVQLLLGACVTGLAMAVPLAWCRGHPSRWLSAPALAFTWTLRGTPLLVQLFLLYHGLAQFEAVRQGPWWPWLGSAWFCAVAAFSLNTCAYVTEILHGATATVTRGEREAARALGMGEWTLWRRIVLPLAARRALPAYGNEVVLMLHGTSLASVVTLTDLTGAAREANSRFYLPFEAFGLAALLYLLLTLLLVGGFRFAERRWLQPLAPRP
jgi:arginine/ornithine transport system permease protein